jgi:hypothetical protein
VLPTKIRLSWEGMPKANTLADYENLQIAFVKSFIKLAEGAITASHIYTCVICKC